jgi:hypothetical protein
MYFILHVLFYACSIYDLFNDVLSMSDVSWGSSFIIGMGYFLDGQGSIPGRGNIFLFTMSRLALGTLSPGVKRPGREADHSPSSAEVKNGGAVPPLPYMSSWYNA